MSRNVSETPPAKHHGLRLAASEAHPTRTIPRDARLDGTLALLRAPFSFISEGCRRLHSDVFETRVLLRRTLCMTGPEAAALVCDPERFIREGAVPRRIVKTLFGVGGVQGLDGTAHRHRKSLFMALMTPERIAALRCIARRIWLERAAQWKDVDEVELYDRARGILTAAVCEWAGVPLDANDEATLCRQLSSLFSSGKTLGPAYWRARHMRLQSEAWAGRILSKVRSGRFAPPPRSPLEILAAWRDPDGEPLDTRTAAVELINLLRPTVATAVWMVYVALALHHYSEVRDELRTSPEYSEWFAQEVRRYYPFFPMIAARVRADFTWGGYRFDKGTRVLLDLYGTDHDPRAWRNPELFDPLRFRAETLNPYSFIPQGPGDPFQHHRCPGERIAVELMKMAAHMLTDELTYAVRADQDLSIEWSKLPPLPRSRFLMQRVRLAAVKQPDHLPHE
jgi:fatty-acid peroxygenase